MFMNDYSSSTTPQRHQPAAENSWVGVSRWLRTVGRTVQGHLLLLGGVVLLLWLIEAADQLIWQESLDFFGIRPHTMSGLRHILFAPFLHRGFGHLLANTVPFFLLGWLVLLRGVGEFLFVSFLSALISGAGIWLFGMADTIHIGMSGVIFGYLGFLLARGYFERSAFAIVLAIVVGLLYGSMVWGVLPLQPNISWLGHLFGLLGGGVAAYFLANRQSTVQRHDTTDQGAHR